MYKGKKWLLEGLDGIFDSIDYSIETNKYVYLAEEVDNLVEQLDEPLMLTKEWVDNNMDYADNIAENSLKDVAVIPVYKLEGLMIGKKEEIIIPQFVADYVESKDGWTASEIFSDIDDVNESSEPISKWMYDNDEDENSRREILLLKCVRGGNYAIEKEPRWVVFYVNDKNKCFKDFNGINGLIYGSFEEAIKFENKEKAEAVALLTDGKIREVYE